MGMKFYCKPCKARMDAAWAEYRAKNPDVPEDAVGQRLVWLATQPIDEPEKVCKNCRGYGFSFH